MQPFGAFQLGAVKAPRLGLFVICKPFYLNPGMSTSL